MNYIILVLEILILVSIPLALLIVRNYLPSYLKKKGEDLATKEDIEEITHKIENVRSQYTSDVERLRSSLQLASTQHTAFLEQQRKALLSFFATCLELIGDKFSSSLGDLPIDDGRSLFEYQESVKKLFLRLYIDYHTLVLYFGEEADLQIKASKILIHSIALQKDFKKHFWKVKNTLMEEFKVVHSKNEAEIKKRIEESNKAAKIYHEAIDPHLKGLATSFQEYLTALNKYLRSQGAGVLPNPL